jgi:hypothetical protein
VRKSAKIPKKTVKPQNFPKSRQNITKSPQKAENATKTKNYEKYLKKGKNRKISQKSVQYPPKPKKHNIPNIPTGRKRAKSLVMTRKDAQFRPTLSP